MKISVTITLPGVAKHNIVVHDSVRTVVSTTAKKMRPFRAQATPLIVANFAYWNIRTL